MGYFIKKWELLGGVSDCEELEGGYSQEMMGLMGRFYLEGRDMNLLLKN
jgi:hypothetical protein